MSVSYLIKFNLFLIIIIYCLSKSGINCMRSHSSHSSATHCNYTIDRIDAITNFTNGSLFVASGQNYWLLRDHEKPIHENALKISDFLPGVSSVEAVVNLKLKIDKEKKKCVPVAEQLMFYSKDENNSIVVNVFEGNEWKVYSDVTQVDVLNAAKSVNWSQPIDALANFDNIVVIFQGNSYSSIRCEDSGEWKEVTNLSIPFTFSGIKGPIDSANFIKTGSIIDDAFLYMFKGNHFFICPVFGNDECNGPLSLVDDFFRFDEECGLNPKYLKQSLLIWIIIAIFVVVVVLVLIAFCCYVLALRSRQITFWVNRGRSKDRNVQLTYEALNGQVDVTTKASEVKAQPTNGNGVDINLEDQTNTPFIDSNGKDEERNH